MFKLDNISTYLDTEVKDVAIDFIEGRREATGQEVMEAVMWLTSARDNFEAAAITLLHAAPGVIGAVQFTKDFQDYVASIGEYDKRVDELLTEAMGLAEQIDENEKKGAH